jgi:hypothetical protein
MHIIAVVIISLIFIAKDRGVETPAVSTKQDGVLTPISSFNWDFEEDSTLNLDGQPQTSVYLLATYKSNLSDRKLIDTVDGSCSKLPGKYEGDTSNAGKIQCYSAGLGQQYRIVAGEKVYSIERKLFEEALPNASSTYYDWERVSEFSQLR